MGTSWSRALQLALLDVCLQHSCSTSNKGFSLKQTSLYNVASKGRGVTCSKWLHWNTGLKACLLQPTEFIRRTSFLLSVWSCNELYTLSHLLLHSVHRKSDKRGCVKNGKSKPDRKLQMLPNSRQKVAEKCWMQPPQFNFKLAV